MVQYYHVSQAKHTAKTASKYLK